MRRTIILILGLVLCFATVVEAYGWSGFPDEPAKEVVKRFSPRTQMTSAIVKKDIELRDDVRAIKTGKGRTLYFRDLRVEEEAGITKKNTYDSDRGKGLAHERSYPQRVTKYSNPGYPDASPKRVVKGISTGIKSVSPTRRASRSMDQAKGIGVPITYKKEYPTGSYRGYSWNQPIPLREGSHSVLR